MSTGKEYLQLVDSIKTMEKDYGTLRELVQGMVSSTYGVSKDIFNAILIIKEEYIKNISYEEGSEFLKKFISPKEIGDETVESHFDTILRREMDNSNVDELTAIRNILLEIKSQQLSIMYSFLDLKDAKKDTVEAMQEYIEATNSEELLKKRKENIEKLKNDAMEETNEVEKKKILTMIETLESIDSFSFIFKRINELGEDELASIMDGFFIEKKGSYIINKFTTKIKLFGFDKNVYKNFFNIEENFLDEEYHIYNNLFLFIYMKFAAYSDPYNKQEKMFVQSLTTSLSKLFYHTFTTSTVESEFLNVITRILDKFAPYAEEFKNGNTTSPTHPYRIKMEADREAIQKKAIIDVMERVGIKNYPSELSYKELKKWYDDYLDEMMEEQRKKEDNVGKTINVSEDTEDGSVTIEPIMESQEKKDDSDTNVTDNLEESTGNQD